LKNTDEENDNPESCNSEIKPPLLVVNPDRFYRSGEKFFINPGGVNSLAPGGRGSGCGRVNAGDLRKKGESKNLNIERPTLNVEEGVASLLEL